MEFWTFCSFKLTDYEFNIAEFNSTKKNKHTFGGKLDYKTLLYLKQTTLRQEKPRPFGDDIPLMDKRLPPLPHDCIVWLGL